VAFWNSLSLFFFFFFLFFAPTSLEAEAADTEAGNCNYFSRANNVFFKQKAKTQAVQVGRAFQRASSQAVAVDNSWTYLGSSSSLPRFLKCANISHG